MIARALRVTVLVAGLGLMVGPAPVKAQLGSYCGTADWCFELTELDFSYTASQYIVALTGSFSGGALVDKTGLMGYGFFTPVLQAGWSFTPTAFAIGQTVTLNSTTGRTADDIFPTKVPAPGDLNFGWLHDDIADDYDDAGYVVPYFGYSCDGDGGNTPGDVCQYTASVPAPGTLPLILSGILGLGACALLRRTVV